MNESVLHLKEKNNIALGFPTFKLPTSSYFVPVKY